MRRGWCFTTDFYGFFCGDYNHGFLRIFCGDYNHGFSQNLGTDFHNNCDDSCFVFCVNRCFIVGQRFFRWGRTGQTCRTSRTCQTNCGGGIRPFRSCCGVVKRIILLVVRILCRRVLALLWCCRWVRGCRFHCRVATLRCYCRRGRLRADICRWA